MRRAQPWLAAGFAAALASAAAQDGAPLDADILALKESIDRSAAACAADAASGDCALLLLHRATLVARAVAELGNVRDRQFLDLVRALIASPDIQVRASALYALAKMQPEAADTPTLRRLALEPYGIVRAGAWSAARASSDPAANAIAARTGGKRIGGYAERPDDPPFIRSEIGTTLPEGASYVWYDEALRRTGHLVFVAPLGADALTAHFTAAAGRAAEPLETVQAWSDDIKAQTARYADAALFEDVRVVPLADGTGDGAGKPVRLAVIYRDAGFDTGGFALVWSPGQNLVPPPRSDPMVIAGEEATPATGLLERLRALSGRKAEADPEESEFWFSVRLGDAYGAALYLEAYPDGAYKAEAQALIAAPRLELDALAYDEGGEVSITFRNMADELDGEVHLIQQAAPITDNNMGYLHTRGGEPHKFALTPYLAPGVYTVKVYADAHGGGPRFEATSELRIAAQPAILALVQDRFPPGAPLAVTYKDMSGAAGDDIVIAKAGAKPRDGESGGARLKGEVEGVAILKAPLSPGDYELRAYYSRSYDTIRASVPFTVAADAPAPPAPPPTSPEAALVKIALAKPVFAVGEPIAFELQGLPGNKGDWFSVAAAGMPEAAYAAYDFTGGVTGGTFTLRGQPAGAYEVRVYFAGLPDVQARLPFKVE